MKGELQDYMYLGIVHGMVFPEAKEDAGAYYETLKRIANDPYFTAVEVGFPPDGSYQRAKKVLDAFQGAVAYGAQGITLQERYDLADLDNKVREEAIQKVCEEIDKANLLGVRRVELTSGKEMEESEREKRKEKLVVSLSEICHYAKEKKTEILLETFDSDIEKKRMLGPSREAAEIAGKVGQNSDNFGLLLDLSHIPLLGEDIEDSCRLVGPYLKHIHIGNCIIKDSEHPLYGDQHPGFGIQGGEIGVEEVREFLAACFQSRYLGEGKRAYVSFEVGSSPGKSAERVIENAKNILQEAWEKL